MVLDLTPSKDVKLGKLSIKDEPAGKKRVFAIVDVWTQSVLQPIHAHVSSILKNIKQDGCYDQSKPLNILREIVKKRDDKTCFSYDLSAATDRFPISIQVQILSQLYSREVADA